jgi:hypothetical protein
MNKQFIKINKSSATWSNRKTKLGRYINCNTLLTMIYWLIDNTFVIIGDQVFKQVIGIPMGTDCAPYLANLFLYSYEFEFMNSTLKLKDFSTLHKFNHCFRYIDDLLTVNNDMQMKDFKTRIYPPELDLNCEDKSDQEVNYLDLNLTIKDKAIEYKLFDKRDKFNFSIVNFPNLHGIFQQVNPMESFFHRWYALFAVAKVL